MLGKIVLKNPEFFALGWLVCFILMVDIRPPILVDYALCGIMFICILGFFAGLGYAVIDPTAAYDSINDPLVDDLAIIEGIKNTLLMIIAFACTIFALLKPESILKLADHLSWKFLRHL